MATILEPAAHTLAGITAFSRLTPEQRTNVAGRCRFRQYAADDEIIRHFDKSRDVYFLVSGRVRATIYSPQGKEVAFRDLGAGAAFGDLSAIDGEPRCATVKALEACAVAILSAQAFWDVMMEHPVVAGEVLKEMAALVRRLSARVVEFSTLDVKHRLYGELLRLGEEALERGASGPQVVLPTPPTHEAIANRIDTHREAVTKVLNQLGRDAVIEKRRGVLVIQDINRLRRMVSEATGA